MAASRVVMMAAL
jgi:hypothetical protein